MEVLDLICHQVFFFSSRLEHQCTTSQYFEPLASQTLPLVSAAIQCALPEYSTGQEATAAFSHDEYRGTFCAFCMIYFTPQVTALIDGTLVVRFKPPLPPT